MLDIQRKSIVNPKLIPNHALFKESSSNITTFESKTYYKLITMEVGPYLFISFTRKEKEWIYPDGFSKGYCNGGVFVECVFRTRNWQLEEV